jgi:hypothetical protein
LLHGPDAVREVMMETQRKLEVSSGLLVETLQRTAHARASERLLRTRVVLARRTSEAGEADTAYASAQEDLDTLKCLGQAIRTHRDLLKGVTHNIRALARLVDEAARAPNPGVREIREVTPMEALVRPRPVEMSSPVTGEAQTVLSDEEIRELVHGGKE